jgi:hypothetical protein
MLEIEIVAGFCLGILASWFLLQIGLAEAFLSVLVLVATAVGIWWFWRGNWGIAQPVGIFALMVVTLGLMLAIGLLPRAFRTKGKARS